MNDDEDEYYNNLILENLKYILTKNSILNINLKQLVSLSENIKIENIYADDIKKSILTLIKIFIIQKKLANSTDEIIEALQESLLQKNISDNTISIKSIKFDDTFKILKELYNENKSSSSSTDRNEDNTSRPNNIIPINPSINIIQNSWKPPLNGVCKKVKCLDITKCNFFHPNKPICTILGCHKSRCPLKLEHWRFYPPVYNFNKEPTSPGWINAITDDLNSNKITREELIELQSWISTPPPIGMNIYI